jgi:GT2 family glycosyltransferase
MVVHAPGPWFTEVLDGLAAQDYPNLRRLFLITGEVGDLAEQIRERVPQAFVRHIEGNPGFGPAANEALRLVEGDNGFFCILHDDVALESDAVRLLVEEMYRSNAGIVGPKLVDWDDPTVLQHVGLGVDRFGEVDPIVDTGEVDQEQHDAVRDVFALPSACLMVRADLFRAVGGFHPGIEFHGDDLDLCWRAQLGGARVIIVPAARARHREQLVARRPDLAHDAMRERHRIVTVATLTGGRRLPLRLTEILLLSLVETLVGLFTGSARRGTAALGAMFGLIPRFGAVRKRRREVAALRLVPDGDVVGLQQAGSARLSSWMRGRDARPIDPDAVTSKRWRQSAGSAPAVAWLAVLGLLVLGSRNLFSSGLPPVGEFLRYPGSPAGLVGDYLSGWWGQGLGASEAVPTAIALIAAGSVGTLFHMGLLHTVGVLGLLVVGPIGIWRLASIFPTPRARITALVVYAAVPLPYQLLSIGRWGAMAVWAATPWVIHLARRAAGLSTEVVGDEPEAERPRRGRSFWRIVARLTLICAIVIAFDPSFALVLVVLALTLAVSTLVAGGSVRASGALATSISFGAVGGVLLNLPWAAGWLSDGGWISIVGVPPVDGAGIGLLRLAAFDLGRGRFGVLVLGLYLAVLAAVLLARSWRFTWAVRAAGLVVVFGWLAFLGDRNALPIPMPEAGVLLAPVVVGLALSAACIAAAFEDDVLRGTFGWRQPLGVIAAALVAVALLPTLFGTLQGRWNAPTLVLADTLDQLADDPPEGNSRTLWIGEPSVMPVGAWELQPGLAYGLSEDGPLTTPDLLAGPPSGAEEQIGAAIRSMAFDPGSTTGTTQRVGRLLAPFGVRYIVIPLADGAVSTISDPLPAPEGLIDALADQLDLGRPLTSPLNVVIYENTSWIPTRAVLTASGAEASQSAAISDLVQTDVSGATPWAIGGRPRGPFSDELDAGTLAVAIPFDARWTLRVDDADVEGRPAFGSTTAFDAPVAGAATLTYGTSPTRPLVVFLQALAWLVLLVVASRFDGSSFRRRRAAPASDVSTVLSFDDGVTPAGAEPILEPPAPVEPVGDQGGPVAVDPEPMWADDAPAADSDEPGRGASE